MDASTFTNGAMRDCGQTVLVLQGGGALGAYQAGVYQALHEHGVEPDWVIGTSIGAINASLIAGNEPGRRLEKLERFWSRIRRDVMAEIVYPTPAFGAALANMITMSTGVGGFFRPNPWAWAGTHVPLGAEAAGYYSTAELRQTLLELIDFNLLNSGAPRITVGAANVGTGEMRYFDSRTTGMTLKHIMASGALPPAFPAVRIEGELYWDGGILSNTPVEAVFDDTPRRDSLVFAVHVWNPGGDEPDTLGKVFTRQKDLQYASRARTHISRQKQIHRLRHVIAELSRRLPAAERQGEFVRELAAYGCLTRMHVVRLLAPPLEGDDQAKDIDFSRAAIRSRWDAGYANTRRVLAEKPWEGDFDPLEGFILHEAARGEVTIDG